MPESPRIQSRLYRQLADAGELIGARVRHDLDAGDDFRALSKAGPLIDYGEGRLTVRAVKLFADGALGSRGAALLAPYSDKPDQSGLLRMSAAEMERKIQAGLAAGYQVNVHAIGDAANRQVLDGSKRPTRPWAVASCAIASSTRRRWRPLTSRASSS